MYRLATMHSVTDGRTDGKTDKWLYHANSTIGYRSPYVSWPAVSV